jgi:hypothetical protein
MKTITKWGLGIGGVSTLFLGYEYWKTKQPRTPLALSVFLNTYALYPIWSTDSTKLGLAFTVPAHAFVMGLGLTPNVQTPVDPNNPGQFQTPILPTGFVGTASVWVPAQLAAGSTVHFNPNSLGISGGAPVYYLSVNDPSPALACVQIVKG